MKKILKRPLFIVGAIIALLVAWGIYSFIKGQQPVYTFAEAKIEDLSQEVSVTGKVKPVGSVDLAFDVSGRATTIGAQVGDRVTEGQLLIQLFNQDVRARLSEAEAGLKSQQARLDELKKGSRPEELQVYETKVASAQAALTDAQNNLEDKVRDSFTKADDAIRSKADKLFSNPKTNNPQFLYSLNNSQLKSDLEASRVGIEAILNSWSLTLALDASDSTLAENNISKVSTFLDKLALAISGLTPDSSITQATIDGYKADIFTARSNVNAAIAALSSADGVVKAAQSNLNLAQRELDLQKAGSTPEQISAQEAVVEQAQAGVDTNRALLSKTMLFSPIGGIVTKQEAKRGEIVSPGIIVVSVMSDKNFQIETNVPEADIAKISVNNTAKVTLDAYGDSVNFDAKVIKIDPAETVVEGVSTYKVTMEFIKEDERVKSGMTANIDILTEQKNGVLSVPQRAVVDKSGSKFVKILQSDGNVKEVTVKTGLKGSNGDIEVTDGLHAGDKVITSTK
jgi:HlyD family secretion protein